MLRNYIVIALRNLRKRPLYSSITIGGLAVGLAACLMILLFVRDEVSYDRWLPNAERIAKLEITFSVPGRDPMEFGNTPGLAKAALEKDFSSDIESIVRIYESREPIRAGDKLFSDRVAYVDAEFFKVFDIPIARGQRDAVLDNTTSIIMSETTANKYFGDAPALGKIVTLDNKHDYKVVGVFSDLPRNTHLKLDLVALFDAQRYAKQPWVVDRWTSANVHTYILFRSPDAIARVADELVGFTNRNVVLEVPGFDKRSPSDFVKFHLMPVLDIHLHARKPGYFKPGGDITTVVTFSIIAALILLIACINFINLATARSMQRSREVAMRKVVGATRKQLIGQFLGEAMVTASIAMVIAVALVEVGLGPYNSMVDKELALDVIGDPALLGLMVGLVFIVGLLGGSYPAIYLSRFRPAKVLKANQYSAGGSTLLRNSLVVFQFAISIGLIVSTAVVYKQTSFARSLDLGYQPANRLVLPGLGAIPGKGTPGATLKREVAALQHVKGVALSSDAPPLSNNNNTLLYTTSTPTSSEKLVIETMRVDHDFFSLYGVRPIAGRVFSVDFPTDRVNTPKDKVDGDTTPKAEAQELTQSIVVNETFLLKVGIASADEAIGKVLWDATASGPKRQKLVRTTIVGVVPDMHLRSIRFSVTPLCFYLRHDKTDTFNVLSINVEPGHMQSTLAAVQTTWTKLVPNVPMRTLFVDQQIAAQYDTVEKRAHMFAAFSLFAVLVACLGLFGLAAFAAERRTKEIGMRKVLGASVLDIVRLLMWQFSRPVLIANLIAWPASFYLMQRWLSTFKYRVDLTEPMLMVSVFAGAGLIALTIAWVTVAGQAARVAGASPIHALRSE